MNKIEEVFNLMDSWRHLPSYQLERRADLFFALYIPQALEDRLGFAIRSKLIPEFPARIGTVCDNTSNRSRKIDYLALSEDGQKAVFVELKTDDSSLNPEQRKYYDDAKTKGLKHLLAGLRDIFQVSKKRYRSKYFCLIEQLAALEQYWIPDKLRTIMKQDRHTGFAKASRNIEVISEVSECFVRYIQPSGSGSDVISFEDLRGTVLKDGDEISARFAKSLAEWEQVEAGRCDQKGRDTSGPD